VGGGRRTGWQAGSVRACVHVRMLILCQTVCAFQPTDSQQANHSSIHPLPLCSCALPSPLQASKRQRQGSESPSSEPLGFHPRSSPSVTAALAADVPVTQTILGARPPRPGSSHRWGVAVSC
jgi:hypothetical protein